MSTIDPGDRDCTTGLSGRVWDTLRRDPSFFRTMSLAQAENLKAHIWHLVRGIAESLPVGSLETGAKGTAAPIIFAHDRYTSDSAWTVVGRMMLTAADFSTNPKLTVVGRTVTSGVTLEIAIYNLTDGGAALATVTISAQVYETQTSAAFALTTGSKIYEVRIRRQGVGADATCFADTVALIRS